MSTVAKTTPVAKVTTQAPKEDLNQLGKNLNWYQKTGGIENTKDAYWNDPNYKQWFEQNANMATGELLDPTKGGYKTEEAQSYTSKYPGFLKNADLASQLNFYKQYDPSAKIVKTSEARRTGEGNADYAQDEHGNVLYDDKYELVYDKSKVPKPKGGDDYVNMGEYESDREINKKYSYLDPVYGPMTHKRNIKEDFSPVDTFGPIAVGALAGFGFPMMASAMSGGVLGSMPSLGAGMGLASKAGSLANIPRSIGQLATGGFNPANLVSLGLNAAGMAGYIPPEIQQYLRYAKMGMGGLNAVRSGNPVNMAGAAMPFLGGIFK